MNIHSYTIIHYGADYIGAAIRSIYYNVDKIHIIYTPHPSHGTSTNLSPIETKEEIFNEIDNIHDPNNKIIWHEMLNAYEEGQQRDAAVKLCQDNGADIILVVDCDEIWHRFTLNRILAFISEQNNARNWLVNFTHLWRSFDYCCVDENWPVRFIDLRNDNNNWTSYINKDFGNIYHFGYAVTNTMMRYKWEIHGHKSELRPNWFDEKWNMWPPADDCHPTNSENWWMPEQFDKRELPLFMRDHRFYGMERIE